MSWVNDLASGLGIPAGAATLAVAMYAACTAAEKAARPAALQDIGRILKDTTWGRSVRPSAIIERVFKWTFGDRHLSWKCGRRSLMATLCIVTTTALVDFLRSGVRPNIEDWVDPRNIFDVMLTFVILSFVPDYLALWKSRFLVSLPISKFEGIFLVVADVILSLAISSFLVFLYAQVRFGIPPGIHTSIVEYARGIGGALINNLGGFVGARNHVPLVGPMYVSTLFTSIWTILILLSTTVLKLLVPVHRFTAWFFDVERHPVQAIGIVAGALVMIGSLIWTVLRAVT